MYFFLFDICLFACAIKVSSASTFNVILVLRMRIVVPKNIHGPQERKVLCFRQFLSNRRQGMYHGQIVRAL